MGSIGGLIGTAGGAGGTGFASPQQADIHDPVNSAQITGGYNGVQGSLTAQNNLLSALQGQNGVGNQNQVYGQLQGIASGAVNPAQAQFNQNTATNVANQGALMAGQRGASSNVGLIAREAAQQGAATQQQAVGQEAAQQSQNQINAIGAAGNLATTQASQQIGQTNANTAAQQAQYNSLLNAQQAYNAAQVGSQQSVNAGNTALAGIQLQGQQGLYGGVMNSIGGGLSSLGGARGGEITSRGFRRYEDGGDVQGNEFDADTAPQADTAVPNAPAESIPSDSGASALAKGAGSFGGSGSSGGGGGGGGMGSLMGLMALMAGGGEVQRFVNGGTAVADPSQTAALTPSTPSSEPQSKFGKFVKNAGKQSKVPSTPGSNIPQDGPAALNAGMTSLGNGLVKAFGSNGSSMPTTQGPTMAGGPGDAGNPAPDTMMAARGGMADYRSGGKVKAKGPQQKAVAPGNNYANDKIPAVLSEHEIVLPRTVTMSGDPVRAAASFVAKEISKRKIKGKR